MQIQAHGTMKRDKRSNRLEDRESNARKPAAGGQNADRLARIGAVVALAASLTACALSSLQLLQAAAPQRPYVCLLSSKPLTPTPQLVAQGIVADPSVSQAVDLLDVVVANDTDHLVLLQRAEITCIEFAAAPTGTEPLSGLPLLDEIYAVPLAVEDIRAGYRVSIDVVRSIAANEADRFGLCIVPVVSGVGPGDKGTRAGHGRLRLTLVDADGRHLSSREATFDLAWVVSGT